MTLPPIHLVKGDDPVLLSDAVADIVRSLVGDEDRALVVEELDADSYARGADEPEIDVLVGAAGTPPFLTDRRVVLARHSGLFSTADKVAPLVAYLAAPLDTTHLVLVWEKGPRQQRLSPVPKKLADAVKKVGGEVVDAGKPKGKARSAWVSDEIGQHPVSLDKGAQQLVAESLGEDLGGLRSLLDTLAAAHGTRHKLSRDDVAPYIVEEGDLAPWDLTDAIDSGETATALATLQRMLAAGRHPLQLMYTLQSHYSQLLALDGAEVVDERDAGELLGIGGYPARKVWQLSQRLDSRQVFEAVELLAQADLDLRGAKAWDPELVMEVLVARLAHRCSPRNR
jgi:DNA polymerase-3 subunit delta